MCPFLKITKVVNYSTRLQVHKDGSRFRYFSRNGNEFTEDFGSDAAKEEELLTGYLAQSLAPHVKAIILGRISSL